VDPHEIGDASRTGFGAFAESLTADDEWDSPESNAQLAADWYLFLEI